LILNLKEHHRMGRNQLVHRAGDAANAILAAVGYNFRRLLAWFSLLLSLFLECPRPTQTTGETADEP
jgi:IS5 family transposase